MKTACFALYVRPKSAGNDYRICVLRVAADFLDSCDCCSISYIRLKLLFHLRIYV